MDKQNFLFTVVLILGVGFLLYVFGAAITGNIVQSMYCQDGICKEFCKFNTDCIQGESCCMNDGFGVCEERSNCILEYEVSTEPNTDFEYERKSPSNYPMIFPILTVILLAVVTVWYISTRKQPKT